MSTQTSLFAPLGVETAPEKSRPLLEKIQKSFKFIPNLFGVFANSPVMLEGYLGLELEKRRLNNRVLTRMNTATPFTGAPA
jgi:hypothetical protein